ncbi:ACO1_3 [Sanghuangporus weigelae]
MGEYGSVLQTAANYRDRGIKWVEISDSNRCEGCSRGHAVLEPRYLGGLTINLSSPSDGHIECFKTGPVLNLMAKQARSN